MGTKGTLRILIFLAAFAPPLLAEGIYLPGMAGQALGRSISYLVDPGPPLKAAEAYQNYKTGQFQVSTRDVPGLGFSRATVWLSLEIGNASEFSDWILTLGYPVHDDVKFYRVTSDSAELLVHTGDARPFYQREIAIRDFAFRLPLKPGEHGIFLLEIRSWNSLLFPLHIRRLSDTYRESERRTLIDGFYLGLLFILGLYNFFLYLTVKDPAYLYYVLYIASFWIFQAGYMAILPQYLLQESPALADRSNPFFASCSFLFGLIFTLHFLRVQEFSPALAWVLRSFALVAAILAILGPWLGNREINLLGVMVSPLILFSAIYIFARKYRPARYFLLAWTGFVVILFIWTSAVRGWIESEFLIQYGLQLGSAVEAVLLSIALGDRINELKREREWALSEQLQTKARLLTSFARFVPVAFLEFLGIKSVEDAEPGAGVRRDVIVMFTDMRNFTRFSEQMDVEDNFRFLNGYLRRVAPLISRYGGFIDKYIGDAIMAIFTESADEALRCALQMQLELQEYNAERARRGHAAIEMGVGLHAGQVILGTVGTNERMDTTIIGETVNLAARIEEQTKVQNHPVLFSAQFLQKLQQPSDFSVTEVARLQLKGHSHSTVLFAAKTNV